ncbi:MAG: hypothetical protein JJT94_06230, partial [Bernardetiaceae bacterium]|nr:hypothetical protein [Bernardetiaceae bacterium]
GDSNHINEVEKNAYFELYYIESKLDKNSFVGDSFLVQAWTDKIQQEEILIINIANNEYTKRGFIPIFHSQPKGYEYQNFPYLSTHELDKIKVYIYCLTRIQKIFDNDKRDKIQDIISLWNQYLEKKKGVWNLIFDIEAKTESLFPLGQVSDLVVENTTTDNQNVTKRKELAEIMATINGWEKDDRLTILNERDVYKPKNKFQGNMLYIATDTQHGEFEVHDNTKKNNHIGAISFDRQKFKEPRKNRTLKSK